MRSHPRLLASLATSGLVVAAVPWGGTASADQGPAYTGFTATATASAVSVEIYEPSIPIPAEPEGEVRFAYSKTKGDSGSIAGRASWIWPGDAVGEGFKTIIEQAGLPPQLGQSGYPLQVNSAYPAGPTRDADEPAPGTIMRTRSTDGQASAETGFSGDGEAQDPDNADGADGTRRLDLLQNLGEILTGHQANTDQTHDTAEADTADAPSAPAVPAPLSVLIDFAGYESVSHLADTGDSVTATARTSLDDISLLGGLVRISGLEARSVATSDGAKGAGSGVASYGIVRIAGQTFRVGPDGLEAAGAPAPIPGLPDDPTEALHALGITLTLPKPVYQIHGDTVTSTVAALELQLDLDPLTKLLHTSALNDILGPLANQLPDNAGPLKSLIGALGNISPRFVITLASAQTTTDTVQGIVTAPPPTQSEPDPGDPNAPGPGPAGPGSDAAPPAVSGGNGLPADTGAGDTSPTAAAAPDLVSDTPGLPPLFSIPGLLMVVAIAGAAVTGSYFRKMGAAALGRGAPCPHGLDSGLPDLRKA